MKLLYVVHQFLPRHITGTEQYVRSLAKGMQARGHDVHVLAYEPQIQAVGRDKGWFVHDEDVDGIPVHRVAMHLELTPNRELLDYHNPIAREFMIRFLGRNEFDVAHVFHLRYLGLGGIEEPRRRGIPVVVNLMDFWFMCPRFTLLRGDGSLCSGPPEGGLGCASCLDPEFGEELAQSGLGDRLARLADGAPLPTRYDASTVRRAFALTGRKERLFAALEKAERVLAPSRFLAGMFEDAGFPKGVLQPCPYGVDPGRLEGHEKSWDDLGKGPLNLGYVGSITEHKGLHVLIAAVHALESQDFVLHVHGHPETHPEYTRRVKSLAGGDPRIVFHGGFAPTELGSVLESLDLVIVPSLWYENTPFSVLEAQAMGLPVLASDLGGMSEIVKDGVNGLLFEAGNQDDLTERLRSLLDNPAVLKDMEPRAVRSLEDNLDELEAIYGSLDGVAVQ